MQRSRAYLDYNASAPLCAAARAAMVSALDIFANPSSVHGEGRKARQTIESARRSVASLAGAKPEHVVFTSGATEAAATLLSPDWRMGRSPVRYSRLYVSTTDHPCILGGGRFHADAVSQIGVDGDGLLDLAQLSAALAAHDRTAGLPMVAMQWANNETGVIQPVAEIARIAKAAGALVIFDAVQAVGRVPVDLAASGADFLILSSHKIGGPKGAGAIIGAGDLMMPVPLIPGGGQEKGHRAGTENMAAIAGFGAAAAFADEALTRIEAMRALRDRFEQTILHHVPDAVIFGNRTERLANTVFFAIPGLKAETAQIAFDLAGIALSAGSACSSGKVGASHVLKAMGVEGELGALRVSIGVETGEAELAAFTDALSALAVRRLKGERAA